MIDPETVMSVEIEGLKKELDESRQREAALVEALTRISEFPTYDDPIDIVTNRLKELARAAIANFKGRAG